MFLFSNPPPAIVSHVLTAKAEKSEQSRQAEKGEFNDMRADLKGIAKIEDAAEMTAEGEKTGAAAATACAQAANDWPRVRSTLTQNGASSVHLARVDVAITNLKESLAKNVDLRRNANEVTGALAPLFTKAGDKVPSPVHTLDYLGRSITLDVQEHNWTRAARDSHAIATTWAQVSAQINARHGGPAAAAHFSKTQQEIARAARSRDSAAALSAAKDAGSAADQLEKVC